MVSATVAVSPPAAASIWPRAEGWMKYGARPSRAGAARHVRAKITAAQTNIPADSQNGNAPPPGPEFSSQPIGSAAACAMK